MKLISAFLFLALALFSQAADTAYNALNAVGKIKGQPYLDNLLNLEGLGGSSQPGTWRMIFEDSNSRAGFREVEIRGGEIISQRAPLKNPYSSSDRVNLDRLQLDSDGAFTVAEREAVQRRISFATANYLLESEADMPVWRVQLLNSAGNVVQTLRIAADSGNILGTRGTSNPTATRNNDVAPRQIYSGSEVSAADQPDGPNDSTELKIHRTAVRTGRNIKNGFKRIGGSFQELFTGRRTIDKDLSDE